MSKASKCECPVEGVLRPEMASWYHDSRELPFVNHEPGECKCTNELELYERDGKQLTLCS